MTGKPIWSGFLTISRAERRALFTCTLLVFLLKFLSLRFMISDQSEFTAADWIAFRTTIDSLETIPLQHRPEKQADAGQSIQVPIPPFDPNTVSAADLRSWKIPERVIQTWINFRNAGGQFYRAEDIQKIYGLPESLARRLMMAATIPKRKKPEKVTVERDSALSMAAVEEVPSMDSEEVDISLLTIDINQSTEEDWIRLPGIGPTYAGKILRFREALGGFSSIDQVAETWNIPDSVFLKIRPYLSASTPYRLIAINQSTEEELAAHPYLSSKQARVIIRYRSHYGPISDLEALQRTGVLKEQDIARLAAYILF